MAKFGQLQSALQTIFDECTPKFVNTMHSIQCECKTEKNKRILVFVRICRGPNADKSVLKSAVYVREEEDFDFFESLSGGIRAHLGCLVRRKIHFWLAQIFLQVAAN